MCASLRTKFEPFANHLVFLHRFSATVFFNKKAAAGRTIDIPRFVSKSSDDTAPTRSGGEKHLGPGLDVNTPKPENKKIAPPASTMEAPTKHLGGRAQAPWKHPASICKIFSEPQSVDTKGGGPRKTRPPSPRSQPPRSDTNSLQKPRRKTRKFAESRRNDGET